VRDWAIKTYSIAGRGRRTLKLNSEEEKNKNMELRVHPQYVIWRRVSRYRASRAMILFRLHAVSEALLSSQHY
jgi:hypothetical protein